MLVCILTAQNAAHEGLFRWKELKHGSERSASQSEARCKASAFQVSQVSPRISLGRFTQVGTSTLTLTTISSGKRSKRDELSRSRYSTMQRISMQTWNATISYLGNLSGPRLAILGLGLGSRVWVWVRNVALWTKLSDRTLTQAAKTWARTQGMNGNRSPA